MKRNLDVVAVSQFINHGFDMQLPRTGKNKFLGLRVAIEMQRMIFFQNFVDCGAYLVFIVTGFWFNGKGNCCFRIFDFRVNDRMSLVAQSIARLCFF